MSHPYYTVEEVTELARDRGAASWAKDAIREGWEPDELARAWAWAKTQPWIPPLVDTEGAQP